MDRAAYHALIESPRILDYGVYLDVGKLLSCQKPLADMVNGDELQFQIVHQVEELWMKLMAYSLVDVIDHLRAGETHRMLTLMNRVHRLMRLLTAQLDVLETMSPREYQEVRRRLGNGFRPGIAGLSGPSAHAIRYLGGLSRHLSGGTRANGGGYLRQWLRA